MFESIKRWIRRYILRRKDVWVRRKEDLSRVSSEKVERLKADVREGQLAREAQLEQLIRDSYLPTPPKPRRRPGARRPSRRPKSKAVHQDIGRFMKGGKRQHKWYRASKKAKIQPEED